MVIAIMQELQMRKGFFPEHTTIETIYFGGGTPSVLSEKELRSILKTVYSQFSIAENPEITLEANPEDINGAKLAQWKKAGINRLSIGVQSFYDEHLHWMNRLHTGEGAITAVMRAQDSGLENITIDLIMGIPHMTQHDWENNLDDALSIGVPHMSVYALTVEPKTALAHQVKHQKIGLPEEEAVAQQFLRAHERLTAEGYEHYEISSYSLPGKHSRHNSAYWNRKAYLGIGPSAHSYLQNTRSWNKANNTFYLKQLNNGSLPIAETEVLAAEDVYHEYIMTGLRKAEGISDVWIQEQMGFSLRETFSAELISWEEKELCTWEKEQLRLTPAGWMIADHLIAALFL